jgi:hypothetical protein
MRLLTAFRIVLPLLFSLNIQTVFAGAPANDDCTGATLLSLGVATTSTVKAATASTGFSVGCATGTADDDVWFKFT